MTEMMKVDTSTAAAIVGAEADVQIATAKKYPRQIQKLNDKLMSMAAPNEESAIKCMYSIPRGGKMIKGPSIRFAEILNHLWGNSGQAPGW